MGVQPQRTNRRGDATRENMLDAALKALATGDPAAVSANRIAKEIGATWGAVKYQFGDADGLWAAVLHRTAERRADVFTPARRDGAAAATRRRHHRHPLRRPHRDRLARDREPARGASPRPRRTGTSVSAHRRRTPVLGTGLAGDVPERVCGSGHRPGSGERGRHVHPWRDARHHVRTPTRQLFRSGPGTPRAYQRHRRVPRGFEFGLRMAIGGELKNLVSLRDRRGRAHSL